MNHSVKQLFTVLALLLTSFVMAQSANDIVGTWESKEKPATFKFYKTSNGYEAKITGIDEETGKKITEVAITNLKYDSKEKKFTGDMKPPGKNIKLSATITVVSKNEIKLVAKKFVMKRTMKLFRKQ